VCCHAVKNKILFVCSGGHDLLPCVMRLAHTHVHTVYDKKTLCMNAKALFGWTRTSD
jgi:hypothetical protein